MPRKRANPVSEARTRQNGLLWAMGVDFRNATVRDLDLDTAAFTQAILEVVASGASVFLRPGSGGRALGIAIWEGDTRHPATWCGDEGEVEDWAAQVLQRAGVDSRGEPLEKPDDTP